MKIAIIGGGAAGFFLGAQLAPPFDLYIFEKAATPLQKVKISGGGRCNVTHACFDPNILVDFYPRGQKELRSVFGRFQPGDTMGWFEERGVPLKIQDDMRVFPVSDNSQDIVECLIKANQKNGTQIYLQEAVKSVEKQDNQFLITTNQADYEFDAVVCACGASKQAWDIIAKMGHKIVFPVPSLFTFNCNDSRLLDLQGTTFEQASVKILGTSLENSGNLLITHWGLSGPAILVLSAWGARELYDLNYEFTIEVNFIDWELDDAIEEILEQKKHQKNQKISKIPMFGLTKRFWQKMVEFSKINPQLTWQEVADKNLRTLAMSLCKAQFNIKGKSTFKEEFVTAGGVDLKQINFKTMESQLVPDMFFAGEVLNIDAVTGGFNFQACWSEAFVISEELKKRVYK